MNKRDFFRSLAVAACGTLVAPGLFLPKLEKVNWKRRRLVSIPNPDYVNATYEIGFYAHPSIAEHFVYDRRNGLYRMPSICYPVRGNEIDEKGQLISIPPFIMA